MADALPQAPPGRAKTRAADIELLEEDARRFLVRDRPAADALWLALLKPRNALLRRYAQVTKAMTAALVEGSEAVLDPFGRELGDGVSGMQAVAETMVAKAILGDGQLATAIMARIEGRVGPRKGDEDETFERRAEIVAGMEALVRAMHERPGDQARDITQANGHDQDKPNGHDPA